MRTRRQIELDIRGDDEKRLSQSLVSDVALRILEVLLDIRDLMQQQAERGGRKD